MKNIQSVGIALFLIGLVIFTSLLGLGKHHLTAELMTFDNEYHRETIVEELNRSKFYGDVVNTFQFNKELKKAIVTAQSTLNNRYNSGVDVNEWDYKIGDWKVGDYIKVNAHHTFTGVIKQYNGLFILLTFGLCIVGGLLYIYPKFKVISGIDHNHIFHRSLSRGISRNAKILLLLFTLIASLIYGYIYMDYQVFWPIATLVVSISIIALVRDQPVGKGLKSFINPGTLGILTGVYFILFYILLYWAPHYITSWIALVDPISKMISNQPASEWFLYGLMYTIIVIVMGVRMLAKYQNNQYQKLRTYSVIFFQTTFAFLIPEILVRLKQPWYDFKNIWPLDYDFFFDYNLNSLIQNGGLGIFMLVWGIVLIVIIVPVMTYLYGKRWYCSWVCGCGGLAETLGDPYRQLSDKSLKSWKYERYIIHGVLVFAIVMTMGVLYSYFTDSYNILGVNTQSMRTWYGFFIGSTFSGVVGTGFYPLMGNRVWCRFGCPLAAYLGIIQKFKSRFRITTNGGQCISCGNCSTYCEMGIDVRHYAQRGQDIVRSSCVGCGVCAAVCPRGVLKLENGSADIDYRAEELRVIHISEDDIKIL